MDCWEASSGMVLIDQFVSSVARGSGVIGQLAKRIGAGEGLITNLAGRAGADDGQANEMHVDINVNVNGGSGGGGGEEIPGYGDSPCKYFIVRKPMNALIII